LSTLLGWRLKGINNQSPAQVKQSGGEKVVECLAAAWHLDELAIQCGFVRAWQEK